ncbi:hypothetical protein C0J52_27023 [Blattella germanica]|nr:hypothetical protein C0J52_27023 [Blattella germanica]
MKLLTLTIMLVTIAIGVTGIPRNGTISPRWNGRGSYYWLDSAYTIWGQAKKNCKPLKESGYYYWGENQPDNYNGIEDCGAFRSDGYLADVSCNDPYLYICEWN